jgi:hypothetical protein
VLQVVPGLITAEPSFSEEIIPGVETLSNGTCLQICESLNLASAVGLHRLSSLAYLVTMLGLFLIWALALLLVANRRSMNLAVIAFVSGTAFLLSMIVSPALLSGDIYSYIIYGRIAAVYGADPYVELPSSYAGDPFLKYVFWANVPTYYGPLWTLVSRGLVLLGGEDVGRTVVIFRGLSIGATLVTGFLIWWSLARRWPDRAVQGLVFFLWSPLVVIELGLSAHNEAFMLVFIALAVTLYLSRRYALGSVALVLAILVKIVAAPLLPLYAIASFRSLRGVWPRTRYILTSAMLTVAATAGVLIAANVGPEILAVGSLGVSADRYQNSLHELAFNWLRRETNQEPAWIDAPPDFQPHWLATHNVSELWSDNDQIGMVRPWTVLLALAPQRGEWIRVYELPTGRIGYVRAAAVGPLERPDTNISHEVAQLEAGPAWSPAALEANSIVRWVSWVSFGLAGLLAVWRSRGDRGLLLWSAIILLAYYWLAAAWIWPWYITWSLVPVAFVTNSRVAVLAALVSATVLTIYPSRGFEGSTDQWIFLYRSIPAFALPLLLWAVWITIEGLVSLFRRAGRSSALSEPLTKVAHYHRGTGSLVLPGQSHLDGEERQRHA